MTTRYHVIAGADHFPPCPGWCVIQDGAFPVLYSRHDTRDEADADAAAADAAATRPPAPIGIDENTCPICKPAYSGKPNASPCVLHGGDPATAADPTNCPVLAVETPAGRIIRERPGTMHRSHDK